jgi:hypothetical protein
VIEWGLEPRYVPLHTHGTCLLLYDTIAISIGVFVDMNS